ncbi:MAG: response regulator transcription factor [Clostridia bacterium]|nr:response regulator transcription factor [Clostridia bacterium]
MIRIAIVEDEERERRRLMEALKRYSDQMTIRAFPSAVDFLTGYTPDYDLIFMDIDMPYLDGLSAAKKLRELDREVCLIFVTNMARYAIRGYEVAAFDFIVKPVADASLALKLDRVMSHLAARQQRAVMVRSGESRLKINVNDILYVEIERHAITYHTSSGDIPSYGTLKSVEELLDDPLFVRCNNCYLVNLQHVTAIEDGFVNAGGHRLLISAPRKAAFEKALVNYLCGERM